MLYIFEYPLSLTIAAIALPSLSLLYAATVQIFNAANEDCSWFHLAKPICIRILILGVTLRIVLPEEGLHHSDVALAVFVIGMWSLVLMRRIRKMYVNGPMPNLSTDLTNRVFMVTGANAGIGRETTRQLVAAGATVIMACREKDRAEEAMEDIICSIERNNFAVNERETSAMRHSNKKVRDKMKFLQLDLSDITSIRNAVHSFREMKIPLHVLINNAGIMTKERFINSKGWELTMSVNHLGHFLLTNLLLPMLRCQDDARVIILTSSIYTLSKEGIDYGNSNWKNMSYPMLYSYSQSKLANILMGVELTSRERDRSDSKVMVHMVHPGLVRTHNIDNVPWIFTYPHLIFSFMLQTLQKKPEAGAYTSVFCATDESLRGKSGEYYINSQATALMQFAVDAETAKDLWDWSHDLVFQTRKELYDNTG